MKKAIFLVAVAAILFSSVPSVYASPVLSVVYVDDTDGSISYNGYWSMISAAPAYGGGYQRSLSNGAYAEFSFVGDSFGIYYVAGVPYGVVDIYVDTLFYATVDQQGATEYVSWDSGSLAYGSHTVRFESSVDSTYMTFDGYYFDDASSVSTIYIGEPVYHDMETGVFDDLYLSWNARDWGVIDGEIVAEDILLGMVYELIDESGNGYFYQVSGGAVAANHVNFGANDRGVPFPSVTNDYSWTTEGAYAVLLNNMGGSMDYAEFGAVIQAQFEVDYATDWVTDAASVLPGDSFYYRLYAHYYTSGYDWHNGVSNVKVYPIYYGVHEDQTPRDTLDFYNGETITQRLTVGAGETATGWFEHVNDNIYQADLLGYKVVKRGVGADALLLDYLMVADYEGNSVFWGDGYSYDNLCAVVDEYLGYTGVEICDDVGAVGQVQIYATDHVPYNDYSNMTRGAYECVSAGSSGYCDFSFIPIYAQSQIGSFGIEGCRVTGSLPSDTKIECSVEVWALDRPVVGFVADIVVDVVNASVEVYDDCERIGACYYGGAIATVDAEPFYGKEIASVCMSNWYGVEVEGTVFTAQDLCASGIANSGLAGSVYTELGSSIYIQTGQKEYVTFAISLPIEYMGFVHELEVINFEVIVIEDGAEQVPTPTPTATGSPTPTAYPTQTPYPTFTPTATALITSTATQPLPPTYTPLATYTGQAPLPTYTGEPTIDPNGTPTPDPLSTGTQAATMTADAMGTVESGFPGGTQPTVVYGGGTSGMDPGSGTGYCYPGIVDWSNVAAEYEICRVQCGGWIEPTATLPFSALGGFDAQCYVDGEFGACPQPTAYSGMIFPVCSYPPGEANRTPIISPDFSMVVRTGLCYTLVPGVDRSFLGMSFKWVEWQMCVEWVTLPDLSVAGISIMNNVVPVIVLFWVFSKFYQMLTKG